MADTWGENDKPAPTESWGTGDKEVRQDPPARGLKGWVGDAAATAIRGAIGVPEAIVGLADIPTGGAVGQFLENKDGAVGFRPKQAREAVSEMLDSDATKQQNADFQAADGFIEKAKVAIQNPSMIARGIGESAPSMFAGGLAARGIQALAKVGPVVAGALGEGVVAGGSAAEQIRQETEDGRLTPTQAALAGVTGLATTVLGVGGGALARRFGVGDVDTLLAQGTKGAARQGFDDAAAAAANPLLAQQAKSIPRSVIEGAVSEGLLEELPQSLAEQLLQNLALDKPWDTDLDSAAVMGILTGGAMGGGAGAYSALTRPTITPGQDMPAPAAEQTTPEMLALPAPVIDVGADGTARTADDRTARLKRIATGDVTDITPVPTRSEAMGLDPAAGTLSAAAALAVDTGVTGTMQESVRAQQEQTDLQAAAQEVQKNRAETPVIDYADLNELDRRFVDSYFDQLDKDTDKFLSMAMEDDDGIPDFGDPSNVSDEDFLRSMGANDQEIQDAIQVASRARSTQEGVGSNAAVAFNDASGTQEGARQAQTPAAQGQASFQVGQKWGKPGRDAYTIEKISEDGKLGFADFGGGDKAWVSFGAESANGWGPLNDQPQGASNGPQADQAQQGSAQQAQGRAAQEPAGAAQGEPQPAGPAAGAAIDGAPAVRALTDGTPTANAGAQAAPAPGPQGAPDDAARATAAGEAWTRMPTTDRQGVAERLADLIPNVARRKNLHRLNWDTLSQRERTAIADLVEPRAAAPAPVAESSTELQGDDLGRNQKGTGPRAQQAPAVQAVAEREGPLQQSQEPVLSQLRGQGDNDAPGPGQQLPSIPGSGRGAAESTAYPGPDEQRPSVPVGQSAVGDEAGAGQQPAQERADDAGQQNANDGAVGAGNGDGSVGTALPDQPGRNDPRAGADDAVPQAQAPADPADRWANATPEQREQILLGAGWKKGSPATTTLKGQDWAGFNAAQRRRLTAGMEAAPAADTPPAPAPAPEASEKERWLKSVADMNRMSGQFGAQIDGISNGRLSIVGNPNATKQGKALMGAVDEARRAGATTEEIAAAATSKTSEAEKPTGATLRDALLAEIAANRMPKDNPALKKLVEAFDGQPATPARMKEAQEALEAAIVLRARETVAKLNGEGPKTTFAALRRLYDSQPLLNVRTSTSIENQAYSTPAPLAYLASRLAGINANTTVLEPTAGNGMLLIGAAPSKAIANELQPARAAELREQGFAKVTERDATERVTSLTVDAVITNPPFGSIKGADGKTTKVKVDGYSLGQIDHLIAARALEAMKDDGKAVLILGANKVPGGISNDDLVFFNWLYSHYDVRSHFEADGKLYQRQGAGWPVRVITIAGRKDSKNVSPAPGTVPRVSTWEEVYDQFENGMAAIRPDDAGAATSAGRANGIEAERLTAPQPAGPATAAAGGREPTGGPASAGTVAGAGAGTVGNRGEREPAAVGTSAGQQRNVQPPAVAGGLDQDRLRAGQPARSIAVGDPGNGGVADNEFQVAYVARSDRKDEGVLIPRNMADPTQAGLNRLEDTVGGIDEFAAKELGYKNTAELHQALMGLQIDSVASAIQQIKGGKGTIIADQCVAAGTRIYDPILKRHTPIEVLAAAGQPINVLSMTGAGLVPAVASAPFRKGIADLFRVTLDDGRAITVTRHHRFLSPAGWTTLAAGLNVGHFLASAEGLPVCNSAASRSVHAEDDLHSIGKPEDFPAGYLTCCLPHHDGAQPRREEDSAPVLSPSQAYARARSQPSSRMGGQGTSPARSHQHPGSGHRATQGSSPSAARAPSWTTGQATACDAKSLAPKRQNDLLSAQSKKPLRPGSDAVQIRQPGQRCAHLLGASEHRPVSGAVELFEGQGIDGQQLLSKIRQLHTQRKSGRLGLVSLADDTGWRRIESIEFMGHAEFFDMWVPGHENYVAEGLVNHNTGIGKGRQAAAIIRWAVKNGRTAVFVTVKPSLFTDMFGDLADIGTDDVAPFIMNVDESIKGPGGEKLFANKAALHRGILKRIADSGAMPDGRNAVFMTYSQINLPNAQRQAIEALAPNAVFVLDESHTAGGDSATGNFIRGVLDQGQGVVYLSATYAKRPDNMPVYFKTDIGEAVADDASLMGAMAAGGLPLQTVVANNLVKAGQMFRRERSYDGVNIANVVDTPNRAAHEKLSDAATSALREIVAADRMFHTVYVKARQEETKAEGSRAMDTAGNQAGASVNHTEFSSVVHNFVRQMLLGLKAQTAADSAIAKLKAGEKPIIAVENTMGSFLAEYAENNGIRPGSPLGNFDYRTVLSRALERTRYLVIQDQTGDKRKVNVTLAELDGATREAYDRAQATIDALDIDIPVSPIDWMRNQITKAGYSVAEITGRNLSVDYSGKRPMLSVIDQQEQRDKVETTRRFNDGRLDSIILNVAGSTGISLHASEKFADRRKRHMVVAQPAQDINIFMQMLGRIHRTGQVELPGYTILGVDLPAEKRPMALTADKMKSLNANTSSNTESATSVQAVSLLNKYGDQVVAQYLDSNMELSRQLGIETPVDSEGAATEEDMARKATGRLALMPVKVQQEFYDEVEEQYRNLINYLNETNQNDLEPRTFDFDARETKQQVIFEGEKPESPFGEDATYGEYSIKAQGKPMTPAEINAAITENLAGQTYQDHANAINKRLQPDLEKYLAKLDDAGKEQAMRQVRDARQFMGSHSIGAMFRVSVGEETYTAVVTNLRSTHKANGNPYAMSKLQVTIALNGSLRSLTVPATQFGKIEVSELGRRNSVESVFAQRGVANERETAKIITGNLLAAYGELRGVRGTIISFTKSDGTSDQGILLPKGFKVEENTQGDYRFRSGEEAYTFLMNGQDKNLSKLGIATRDQQVRVTPVGTAVQIRVPKSKARGAKFFLDKALIEAAGADFVSTATTMNVTVPADRAARALEVLSNKQALYALPSMAAEAKDMATVAPEAPPTDDNGEDFAAKTGARGIGSPTDRAVMGLANAGASTTDILNLIQGTSRNLQNKELARKLVALGINPKVVVGTSLGSGDGYRFIAKYTNSTDTITMSEAARDRAEYTFLHEAVHAATVQALNRKGLASIQMQNLYQHVMGQDAALNHYGMKNVREFVAEAFTNPEFQAALKGINAPRGSTLRNAWDAFVRIVRDILGLQNDDPTPGKSVLDEVMAAGASLMRENAESTGRGNAEADIVFAGQAQTESPEFKRWFKDSKVVDADGKPLVVYHGTSGEFSEFKTGKRGAFFASSPESASAYAGSDVGSNVMPAYLSVKDPYIGHVGRKGPEIGAVIAKAKRDGHDGAIVTYDDFPGEQAYVAFHPAQIKSAIGNRGTFDPADDDISYFGLPELRTLKATGLNELQQTLTHAGKVSVWDNTVGTMRNLAERQPLFRPVFDAAQRFIDDVAMLANDAADYAPSLLPRVETLGDIFGKDRKKAISAEDNKAIARPLFEGTLMWARDVDGSAVLVDDLQGKYQNLPTADKAQLLLKAGRLDPQVLRMWQGLPVDQFDSIINAQFNSKMLKAGVVWSDKELSEIFKATPGQISLYREARAGIDRSLDMTSRTDMLRLIGQDYAAMRDAVLGVPTLADARDLITDTLMQDARANPEQTERLTAMNNAVVKRYEDSTALMAEGYAPLSRFGRYTVDVVDQAGERQYFGMFESMREANQMAMQMRSVFPGATVTSGTMSAEAYKLFSGVTPESLERFGEMLGLDASGQEAKDKAFQAYLQLAKNNHSALKRLIHRKGIAGYSEDVGRVLASFIYSNARLGAGGLNAGTMEAAIQAIPKEQGELRDVALKLRDYTSDPQEEGQAIRGMLFAQYLGGSLASAFVNTTQPFTVTLPYLSQFGGIKKAGASLARAMKDMGTKGFKYDPELANALRHAEDDGVVSPQEIHQLMAQARGAGTLSSGDGTRLGNARAGASNAWERTKVAWGQPFAIAEQFNRRSTFIAAFRLAKQEGMKNPAGFARKAVLETQFLYSKANKPRWARGAIGGTLMTFKTYSISYLELLNRTWNAGEPGSPERAAGRRAVGWSLAMLLLMGGAGGLPFMEDLEDLIDGIGQLMGYNLQTKQWRKQAIRDIVGKEVAEFMEQGVSGLPGVPIDVSGRLGMGNLIPGTGLFLTKPNRERDLLEIAGPAGDLVARGFSGARKLLTGDVGGAAMEAAPTAVRNVAKGVDMATSGIYKDTKGYKVIDTTLDEALAKAIGFQPKAVAQVQEANSAMQRAKSFYTQTSSDIKAQWAAALFNKDDAALEDVKKRLDTWNLQNPDQKIVVKMPDIWKKVREMGKDRTDRIADTAPKALRQQMREMAADVNSPA